MTDGPLERLAAIVVTHNPDVMALQRLVSTLRNDVGLLLLVDNASENQDNVLALANDSSVMAIPFGENLGIAEAVNRAVRSLPPAVSYFCLFDQDSSPQGDYCRRLLERLLALDAGGDRGAAIAGTGLDQPGDRPLEFLRHSWLGARLVSDPVNPVAADFVIASGSLHNRALFEQQGGFDARLFVDNVDIEYGYRCKGMGLQVIGLATPTFKHQLGDTEIGFGQSRLRFKLHSPSRLKIMTASRFFAYRLSAMPLHWKLWDFARFLSKTMVILLLADSRPAYLRSMVAGAVAGVRGVAIPTLLTENDQTDGDL